MVQRTEPVVGQQTDTLPPPKHAGGRPSDYTQELAEKICDLVTQGGTLNKICRKKSMPSRNTLYRWLLEQGEFRDMYARACEIRREIKFESLEDMIDKEKDPQKARLKLDAFKWQLSKEEPRKYGDRLDLTTGGERIGRGMTLDEINEVLARAEREKAAKTSSKE